jgi:hypothetical protein
MVLSYINAVSIMVGIAAPHKVMPPQILIVGKIISKERIAAKNRWREY